MAIKRKKTPHPLKPNPSTWAEIDISAVEYNLKEIRRLAARNKFILPNRPKTKKKIVLPSEILAVIKAEAYGHGMNQLAQLLDQNDVNYFAVSDIQEGIALRELGIEKPILLFESTLPEFASYIVDYDLMPTVCTLELAEALNKYAKRKKKNIFIHIEVDTGMGRLGVWYKKAFDFIKELNRFSQLTVHGIYTHFPSADTDKKFTQKQIQYLYKLVSQLDKNGLVIPFIHAANSMGLAGYKTDFLNLVRPGLMIYGLYPNEALKKSVKLKPVMSIKSRIIFLKRISKGRGISYGRTFISKKKMHVATIPIGYNDGYPIGLSNKSAVLINGVRCPVVGKVTMDQIIVDVSKVPNPKLGMPVIIMGKQKGEEITADELAQCAQTINYEIVCNLGNRLPRVYK